MRDGCEYNFEWGRKDWVDYQYLPHTWRSIYVDGEYAGGVILARFATTRSFCVVTYKIDSFSKHNERTWMEAHIWRDGHDRLEDEGNFGHWAGVTDYFVPYDECINYSGYIEGGPWWDPVGARRTARYCPE